MLTQPTFADGETALLGKIAQSLYLGVSGGVLTVTNSEKLALTSISIGQVVHVTDGIVIDGIPGIIRFFWDSGTTLNGKKVYFNYDGATVDAGGVFYDGSNWIIDLDEAGFGIFAAVAGNENNPWQANFSGDGITVNAPPSSQSLISGATSGMIVAGGLYAGVYPFQGYHSIAQPTVPAYLGVGAVAAEWLAHASNLWGIHDTEITGTLLAQSNNDAATPDLATWTGITVTARSIASELNWAIA